MAGGITILIAPYSTGVGVLHYAVGDPCHPSGRWIHRLSLSPFPLCHVGHVSYCWLIPSLGLKPQ